MSEAEEQDGGYSRSQGVGLVLGGAVFLLMQFLPAPEGLSVAGWDTASIVALIAIWWVTEALPLPATALVPLAAFPLLDVMPIRQTAYPYANPIIFLMLGGFIIALGMQRWGLHKRIALNIVALVGSRPANIVGGFMVAAALVSMWVFNTTTTVMMVPIALSVIDFMVQDAGSDPERQAVSRRFGTALMIGIAYAATIGGMGTLIGTAPNALLAGFMSENYDFDVSFVSWMMIGIPAGMLLLPTTWLILTRFAFPLRVPAVPGQAEMIAQQLKDLGPMTRGEKLVAAVVAVAAVLWIFRPIITDLTGIPLHDTAVAILAAVAMFLIPVEPRKGVFVLSGDWAAKLPWGVVILFGGGLSLASGITSSGFADWIGMLAGGLENMPTVLVILGIVIVMVLLTEVASNTASTASFLPIVAAVAIGIGESPLLLVFPTVLAASCAFMMPVATPPNAVVFASGHIRIKDFLRAGVFANLAGIAITMVMTYTIVAWVFGIDVGSLPDWAVGLESQD